MTSAPQRHSVLFLSSVSMLLAGGITMVAWGLVQLISLITNLAFYQRWSFHEVSPANHGLGLLVVMVPVIGAVIIGFMARYGSKAIRGHGIPEAMEQILTNRSRIPARITVLKPLSAAISIGTGGPFGAEGPIIATGGALGSLVGQIFSVTVTERKTLLAAGAAAGMTAIFGSPVSAVLLAIELLLFEFSARSIIPVALACATASALRLQCFGPEAIFAMPEMPVLTTGQLLFFVPLGAIVGVAAAGVSRTVYWVEDQFEKLPIHWMWWPAIGAVAVGGIGYLAPRTLGVGYNNIQDLVSAALPLSVVAWLCGMKLISWLIALGSGTSGGTLAPLLTIGAGLGSLLAYAAGSIGVEIPAGVAAAVGMAAMFAGASRALLASVVFAFETTQQPQVLPALLAGATAAYLVAHLVSRHSIMTEKITRRGFAVPHSYMPDPLQNLRVGDVMSDDFHTLSDRLSVAELSSLIGSHDPLVSRRQAYLLLNEQGRLSGIVTRGDLVRCGNPSLTVLEAGGQNLRVAQAAEPLQHALTRMLQHNIGRLPVVDANEPDRVVGYLGRAEILAAPALAEAEVNEAGWIEQWSARRKAV
ncbi:MAG: chloride channel protein [Verrucomicrobiota bacterium]